MLVGANARRVAIVGGVTHSIRTRQWSVREVGNQEMLTATAARCRRSIRPCKVSGSMTSRRAR